MLIRLLIILLISFSSTMAFAKTCPVSITGMKNAHYNKDELDIDSSCTKVKLTLKDSTHKSRSVMGHGWVLARSSDMSAIASDGVKAGLKNNFVKPNDPRVIAHTKVIGGGHSTTITFSTDELKKSGDYTFFCPFPGHHVTMHGRLKYGSSS